MRPVQQRLTMNKDTATAARTSAQDGSPLTHTDILAMSIALRRPASTLIALASSNDPFFLTPARMRDAEWFHELWQLYAPDGPIHLRRMHYWLVSLPETSRPTKADGMPYANTHEDWQGFLKASLAARAASLVDAGAFVDRRNGEPTFVFTPNDEDSEAAIASPTVEIAPPQPVLRPSFTFYANARPDTFPTLPGRHSLLEPEIAEPYALELCVEKSTANDILLPLARRHGVTLVVGAGELSVTHVHQLVERVREHGRKTRILYISDYDPSGLNMPVSVARKIEFILRRDGLDDLDIRLHPLALTREQVEDYRLPRIPIKDSDRRKASFEERNGEGAVELDALEALHPGELARIVEEAIAVYRQPSQQVREEIEALADQFAERCAEVHYDVIGRHAEPIAQLHAEFATMLAAIATHQQELAQISAEIAEQYEARIDAASEAIDELRAQFHERAEEVFTAIGDDLETEAPDPDDVAWPTAEDAEADESGDDPLFDSQRGYLTQIDAYKRHQGKPTSGRMPSRSLNGRAAS
jgi:hypothetical protein